MANDREIVRNEIKCLLKVAADAEKEEREVIRAIIIKLLGLFVEGICQTESLKNQSVHLTN